jgi:nicotinamide-nucleotide amidase
MTDVSRIEPDGSGRPVVPLENEVVEALVAADWTVAVAESLTAGTVAARLCFVPGTEDRVLGGVVGYATVAKRRVLGIAADSVVSAGAAGEMARAVRDLFGADVGVGLTGVAGPERQDDRPVGTVHVAWCTPDGEGGDELACVGTPDQVRASAAQETLALLLGAVRKDGRGR